LKKSKREGSPVITITHCIDWGQRDVMYITAFTFYLAATIRGRAPEKNATGSVYCTGHVFEAMPVVQRRSLATWGEYLSGFGKSQPSARNHKGMYAVLNTQPSDCRSARGLVLCHSCGS